VPDDAGAIPVVLSVDVEPDGTGHDLTADGRWDGVAATRAWVDEIRERTTARTGRAARVSWFLRCDPQVEELFGRTASVEADPQLVPTARDNGDELGLHVHGWRRRPDGSWVDDYRDDAWLDECIDRSFATFADIVGAPCRVGSMGNRFLGPTAVAGLVRNGLTVDNTGEPASHPVADGHWAHVRGDIPDYRRMPRRPHPIGPGLVELPLTAGRKRLGLRPRAHLSRMRRHGVRQRLDQPAQLGGRDLPGLPFGRLMSDSLRHQRRPYLSFAVRSDGLLDPVQRPRLVSHVDQLLALPEAERFAFMTPTEAVAFLGSG
jgi:hypothetical protein